MELDLVEYRSSHSINKEITYELSALINADSLFYGVLDYSGNLIWAASIDVNNIHLLKEQLLSNDIRIRKFKVGVQSQLYTIVPNKEYSSVDSRELLMHANKVDDPDDFLFRNDYSEKYDLRYVYAIKSSVVKNINSAFDNCSLVHASYAFLEWCQLEKTTDIHHVYLCFYQDGFDLTVLKNNTLLLANTFKFGGEQDIVYFLGLTFERLGLDPLTQKICIGGFIKYDGSYINAIREYFGHVVIDMDRIKSDTKESQRHYHLPLYMISKCA